MNKAPKYRKFFISITKFLMSSAVATAIDFLLFTFVLTTFLPVFESELIAGFVGMCINFVLQKKYVFELKRNQIIAFVMSIAFSLVALILGAFLMKYLVTIELLATYLFLSKIIVIGSKFFFNYFTKRWIFEKRWLMKDDE